MLPISRRKSTARTVVSPAVSVVTRPEGPRSPMASAAASPPPRASSADCTRARGKVAVQARTSSGAEGDSRTCTERV